MNDPTLFTEKDIKAFRALNSEDMIPLTLIESSPFDLNENIGIIEEPDPLKLAVATYVVYSMSRDGMGTAFSSSKFHSSEAYYKQIDRLYRVAERLSVFDKGIITRHLKNGANLHQTTPDRRYWGKLKAAVFARYGRSPLGAALFWLSRRPPADPGHSTRKV